MAAARAWKGDVHHGLGTRIIDIAGQRISWTFGASGGSSSSASSHPAPDPGLRRVELPVEQPARGRALAAILVHGVVSAGAPTPEIGFGTNRNLRHAISHHIRDGTP